MKCNQGIGGETAMTRTQRALLSVAVTFGLTSAAGAASVYFSAQGVFTASSGSSEDFYITTPATSNAASPLILQTLASSGGTNAAGEVVPSGGIDSILKLYTDPAGLLVASNDDASGSTHDSLLANNGSGATLIPSPQSAGNYRVNLTNYSTAVGNKSWAAERQRRDQHRHRVRLYLPGGQFRLGRGPDDESQQPRLSRLL